jgi:glucose-6-phosphate 1-dehydrogenase
VETFAALRLEIHSWRWQGVPFFIRAGKCLPVTCAEVLVTLRRPPALYAQACRAANYFRFRLSPDIAIALGTAVMGPDEQVTGECAELIASRHHQADEMDAYERLLGEAMKGDATLFAREDTVEEAWRIVGPVLGTATPVHDYEPGTWGPPEADQVTAGDGGWHNPTVTT